MQVTDKSNTKIITIKRTYSSDLTKPYSISYTKQHGSDNSTMTTHIKHEGQRQPSGKATVLLCGPVIFGVCKSYVSVLVGPCHHGMARPQVADRGTASDKEGSCE